MKLTSLIPQFCSAVEGTIAPQANSGLSPSVNNGLKL